MTRRRAATRRGVLCAAAAGSVAIALTLACATERSHAPSDLDEAAGTYLQLVDQLTAQDAQSAGGDSVTRPASSASSGAPLAFADIAARARAAAAALTGVAPAHDSDRRAWLAAHLTAVSTRAAMKAGVHLTVREELEGLFGITGHRAQVPADELDATRAALLRQLPGAGSPGARLDAFEQDVIVPRERLPAVFERALEECRTRTRRRLPLPDAESVTVTYVSGEPWSAFSTYLGAGLSRIDVNAGFPLTVDRALALACHEGYPGHHVLNLLRDRRAKDGRPELGAIPLFSPESFASEAAATTAASLVFSSEERLAFERDVLFPLAGLDPALAAPHLAVARLVDDLGPAIEAALLRYLEGHSNYVETLWTLQDQAFMHHPEATLAFVNQHRSFALAYTWARPSRTTADPHEPAEAWRLFEALLAGDYRKRILKSAP